MTAAGSRVRPARPVLGVGAVIVEADRVVLVKRAQPPLMGAWSLPGGTVELGEPLAAAVRREVLEETGLDVDVGPVVEVFERLDRDRAGAIEYHFVVVDYKCRPAGGVLAAGSDAADARWVHPGDLHTLQVAEGTVGVIRKALAMAWPVPAASI